MAAGSVKFYIDMLLVMCTKSSDKQTKEYKEIKSSDDFILCM